MGFHHFVIFLLLFFFTLIEREKINLLILLNQIIYKSINQCNFFLFSCFYLMHLKRDPQEISRKYYMQESCMLQVVKIIKKKLFFYKYFKCSYNPLGYKLYFKAIKRLFFFACRNLMIEVSKYCLWMLCWRVNSGSNLSLSRDPRSSISTLTNALVSLFIRLS